MSFIEELASLDAGARQDAEDLNKLDMYIESAYAELLENYKKSDEKVVQESGEQSDLDYLYEKADLTFKERVAKAWTAFVVKILSLIQKITGSAKVKDALSNWEKKYASYTGNATYTTEDFESAIQAAVDAINEAEKIINGQSATADEVEKKSEETDKKVEEAGKKKKKRFWKNAKKEAEKANDDIDKATKKAEIVAKNLDKKKVDENTTAEEAAAVSKSASLLSKAVGILGSIKSKIASALNKPPVEAEQVKPDAVVDADGTETKLEQESAEQFLSELDALLESFENSESEDGETVEESAEDDDQDDEVTLEEAVDSTKDAVTKAVEDGVITEEDASNMMADLAALMEDTDLEDDEEGEVTEESAEEDADVTLESLEAELGLTDSFFEETHPLDFVESYINTLTQMQEDVFCEWEVCDSLMDELNYMTESEAADQETGDTKVTETKKKGIVKTVWTTITTALKKLYDFITMKLSANFFANLARQVGDKKFVIKYDIDKVVSAGNAVTEFITKELPMKGGTIQDQDAKLQKLSELKAALKDASEKKDKSVVTVSNIEAKITNLKNALGKTLDASQKYEKEFTTKWSSMNSKYGDKMSNPQKNYPEINTQVSAAFKLIETTYNSMVTYLLGVLPKKEAAKMKNPGDTSLAVK